jgi:hypothetical protein
VAPDRLSGQKPFAFAHRADLYSLPPAAQAQEVNLHGGFAVDPRPGQGQIYYGMPGCGILRVDPDLQRQEIIRLEGRPAPIYILDAQSYELLSIIRPKEELDVDLAQHLHNVLLYSQGGDLYLVCQSWNPGHYFVLQAE